MIHSLPSNPITLLHHTTLLRTDLPRTLNHRLITSMFQTPLYVSLPTPPQSCPPLVAVSPERIPRIWSHLLHINSRHASLQASLSHACYVLRLALPGTSLQEQVQASQQPRRYHLAGGCRPTSGVAISCRAIGVLVLHRQDTDQPRTEL